MDLIKSVFKITLLVSLLLLILFWISPFFLKNNHNYYKYHLFYEKDNLDLIVLGNSHADSGINYRILRAKIGLDSYNLSFEGANIYQTYYNLLEVLKYHQPRFVIIENHTFLSTGIGNSFLNKEGKMNFRNSKSLYGKKIGLNKYNEAREMFQENALYNTVNTFKFHDNWTDLEDLSQFLYKVNSKKHEQNFNGYVTKTTFLSKRRQEKIKNEIFDEISIVSKDEKTYLNKIIELSQQNNFEILFVTVPFYNEYYNKTKKQYAEAYEILDSIVTKHNNVKLLDVNKSFDYNHSYFIDEQGKNYKNQHLNYKGSTKSTNQIADFITSNFNIVVNRDFEKHTIEDYAYQNFQEKNDSFEGNVNKINNKAFHNKKDKKSTFSKGISSIEIEGWMRLKEVNNKNVQKFVVLKGENGFIYVSLDREIKDRKTPLLLKNRGIEYEGSGYTFKIPKQILEKGKYEIFHGLLTKKDNCYFKKMDKQLIIE